MMQRVFLPGFTMSPLVFSEVFSETSQANDRPVVFPGHGGVAAVATAFDWLPYLAAQLPESPSWLIGWSLGGRLALALAKFCPEKVAAITLLTSNPQFLALDHWPGMALKNYELFQKQLLGDTEKTWQQFLHWQFWQQPNARFLVTHWQKRLLAEGLPSQLALQQGFFWLEQDARSLWQTLPQPIVALFAGRDALVPSAVAESLAALPLAATAGWREIVLWPEAGHGLPLANASALKVWLGTIEASLFGRR